MKTLLSLLLCAALISLAYSGSSITLPTEDNIVLETGAELVAENGDTHLKMGDDGNLVLYCSNGKMVWESDTADKDVHHGLKFSTSGSLYLENEEGKVWESKTRYWRTEMMELVVQDDSNLVLYNADKYPVWASDTVHLCADYKEAGCSGDRCVVLAEGEEVMLSPGKSITAPNGKMTLEMQMDGNLVAHCGDGVPQWKSGTKSSKRKRGSYSLYIKSSGEMCIVAGKGMKQKWSNNKAGKAKGAILVVQDDDNIVLYTKDGTPLWHTNTFQAC